MRHNRKTLLALVLFACGGCAERRSVAPVSVSVSSGNQQTAAAGHMLLGPLAAKVSDANGRGVPNVIVEFRVLQTMGKVDSVYARTNGAGIATTRLHLGKFAGQQERVAAVLFDTLTGALIDTALFTATITAGPPAKVVALSSLALSIVGPKGPEPMRVLVTDAFDNPLSGVSVTWLVASGKGKLATTRSVSNAQGVAENSLTLRPGSRDVVVQASAAGVPAVEFGATTLRRSTRLTTTLARGAFGLALTPAGQLLTTLSETGQVQRIPIANPNERHVITLDGPLVVIATDAAGRFAYATNTDGSLQVIDVASASNVASIRIPGKPHSLAMSPRGDRVYVTNTENSVFAVDVATRTIVGEASVGTGPWGITFWTSVTDSLMYVTSRDGRLISEVDMRSNAVLRTFAVDGRPHGITISPDGSTLFVADDTGGKILFVDRLAGVTTSRISEEGAFAIAITPDGKTLYVTTNQGYFVVVDVLSATITKRYAVGGQPRQIVVLPGGQTALAANMGGWIDVVSR